MPEDGNRYEVIRGVLYVSPAPTYKHQFVAGELAFVERHAARRVRQLGEDPAHIVKAALGEALEDLGDTDPPGAEMPPISIVNHVSNVPSAASA